VRICANNTYARRVSSRIHLIDRRCENEIDRQRFQFGQIVLQIGRVSVKVLSSAKLARVHKDRDCNVIGRFARSSNKRQMALMKGPHCRDERQNVTARSGGTNQMANLRFILNNLHRIAESSVKI
jgi:hypothetical protein